MVISINNNKFNCKVVSSPSQIRDGMMGKTFDGFDGMFFIMPEDGEQSFWMKNCIIPLDIIMIKNNVIVNIHHDCPPCLEEDCPSYCGNGNIVLELEGGTCEMLGIEAGDTVEYHL